MSNLTKENVPTVKPYKQNKGLAQIYQSMALLIGLAMKSDENEFEQVTPGVLCRDFLCDVYSSTIQKTKFGIYGMSWDGTSQSPDFDEVHLTLVFPKAKAKTDFDNNLRFLFGIEDTNKIPRTVVYDTGELSALVIGNKAWLQNVLTFSLYTFLLRAFSYPIKTDDWIKELGAQGHSDSRYIASIARETWDRVLGDLSSIHTEEFCGLSFEKDSIGAVHHNSGFISCFGSHSEMSPATVQKNKHWKTMKERKFKLFTN